MSRFIFESYDFDSATGQAHFKYRFDDGRAFEEVITFKDYIATYDRQVLDKALFLAFSVIGTSYFKTFPTTSIAFEKGTIDDWQAEFLNKVYQEGLGQFAFENNLTRDDLAHFEADKVTSPPLDYKGSGTLVLQSGGKDSLLTASLLEAVGIDYTPWYLGSSDYHPTLLNDLDHPIVTAKRLVDRAALSQASADGGMNGHVPVTFIVQSLALIQAILLGKDRVLVSIAHEGEEPHAMINDLAVTHQWSKTWDAEQLFAKYVVLYISPNIKIGSPLRRYSELRVAELFVQHVWKKFGYRFSSCNRANYKQGEDNSELHWCGECPKCANAFILFAPFVEAEELVSLFAHQDLFTKPLLIETFKGLLGIDGVMKPFECVGEIDELRAAYHWAQSKGGYQPLPFDVPSAEFDYQAEYPSQHWAQLLQ